MAKDKVTALEGEGTTSVSEGESARVNEQTFRERAEQAAREQEEARKALEQNVLDQSAEANAETARIRREGGRTGGVSGVAYPGGSPSGMSGAPGVVEFPEGGKSDTGGAAGSAAKTAANSPKGKGGG